MLESDKKNIIELMKEAEIRARAGFCGVNKEKRNEVFWDFMVGYIK